MNPSIIIQARQSSTRFPNKVIKKILGHEIIVRLCKRLELCKNIDQIIVATSDDDSDNKLIDILISNGIEFFRGDLHNVLKRYYNCSVQFDIKRIVRITADNPFVSPQIVDDVINLNNSFKYEFIDAFVASSSPHGIGCQFFTFNALNESIKNSKTKEEKEHVTIWMRNNPEKILSLKYIVPYIIRRPDIRLALDYEEDFLLIREIYKHFKGRNDMTICEIIKYLDNNPSLKEINKKYNKLMLI